MPSASISQADRIFQKEARSTARSILARIDRAASLFPVSDANRQLCHATLDDIGHGQTFEKNRHNAIYPDQDRSHLRSDILPQNAIYPRWARPRRSRLESDPSGGAGGWGVDRTVGGRQIWKKWKTLKKPRKSKKFRSIRARIDRKICVFLGFSVFSHNFRFPRFLLCFPFFRFSWPAKVRDLLPRH